MSFRDELRAAVSDVVEGLATGALTITHQTFGQIGQSGNGRPGFASGKLEVTVRAVCLANIDDLIGDIAGGHEGRDIPFRISREELETEGMTLHELMAGGLIASYLEDGGEALENLSIHRVTPDAGRQGLKVWVRM